MPVQSKELVALAGVGIASLIAGGAIGYLLSRGESTQPKSNSQPGKSFDLDSADPIIDYIISNSLQEPSILRELREYTMKNVDMAIMVTDPMQCQLFRILLKSMNAKKCLEVGVFTGYNVLNMALCLPDDGKVVGLDTNERWVNHGRPFFKKAGVDGKIDIKINPAADSMETMINEGEAGTFDFIYIDADKVGYDTYYEKGLVLLRKGGIIALDNMLQHGLVVHKDKITTPSKLADVEALDALCKKIHQDDRVEMSYLNIADGVMFTRKL